MAKMTLQPMEPGLVRLIAPNPSPMTEQGTNTYLLGETSVVVIDPGPDIAAHQEAILAAIAPGARITHIVVTHAHRDHSLLASGLSAATGAPIWAYGTATQGRSPVMERLAADGLAGGGEGLDHTFAPDYLLRDGDTLRGPDWSLRAMWTPGHIGGHLSLVWNDVAFSGDHVMGWASSLVSPPDGDLTQFMESCARLKSVGARRLYPGHGAPIDDPAARIDWLITHRRGRETQIREALTTGPATVSELTRTIYTDVPPALFPAAERNVFAHLVDLTGRGLATAHPHLALTARFQSATFPE